MIISRSTTGRYHLGAGPNATACNSSGRGLKNRPATLSEVNRAHKSSFCAKCFPNGKPDADFITAFIHGDAS